MKHTKIYHAITGNPNKKWVKIFDKIVDVDPAFAEQENAKFEQEGIKYEPIEEPKELQKQPETGNQTTTLETSTLPEQNESLSDDQEE